MVMKVVERVLQGQNSDDKSVFVVVDEDQFETAEDPTEAVIVEVFDTSTDANDFSNGFNEAEKIHREADSLAGENFNLGEHLYQEKKRLLGSSPSRESSFGWDFYIETRV